MRRPGLALLLDLLEALGEDAHALPDQAPVGLELRLARTAQANAALLALQVRPAAHQAARDVLQLRQFHLELAFEAARALRKDVENQAVAIEHAPADVLLEIALLARRERMIDENDVRYGAAAAARTSSALPLPMKKRGSGRSRRPVTVATGCAPAERASCSSSRRSSGSTAAPNPSRTSTARSPLLGRSNTHTSVSAKHYSAADSAATSLSSAAVRLTLRAGTTVEMACLYTI